MHRNCSKKIKSKQYNLIHQKTEKPEIKPNQTITEYIEQISAKIKPFALPKSWAKLGFEKGIIFKYNVQGGTNGIYMECLGDNKNWMNNSEEEILLGRNLIGKFKSHTSFNNYELIEVDIFPDANVGKNTVHKFWKEASIEERWK